MIGTWWQAPVALRFGVGTLAVVGEVAAPYGPRAVLVVDERMASGPAVDRASQSLAAAGAAPRRVVLPVGEPDARSVHGLAADLSRLRADVVVGLGGGAVMDACKLAVAARRARAVADVLARPPARTVLELAARPARRGPRLVLVPTTHATGAEASGVASFRAGDRKHLVVGPELWADVALVDPALGTTLPRAALRAGCVETWSRAFAGFAAAPVAGTTPRLADAFALEAGRTAVATAERLGADEPDLDAHVEAAAAASTTALGWAALGRDRHGARLWQAQNELSAVGGATKAAALPALLPAYVAVGSDGPTVLGDPERIARFVATTLPGPPGAPAADRVGSWLRSLALTGGLPGGDDRRLRTRIAEAWTAAGAPPDDADRDAGRLVRAAGPAPG